MNTTRKAGLALAALAALGFAATAPAQAQTLYNTGVDSNGSPLGDGATEQHYTLVSVPLGSTNSILVRRDNFGYPLPDVGPYLPDTATSAWIGPANDHSLDSPDGLYDYRTTFTLTDLQASTFLLNGRWSTDNEGVSILLNGSDTGNPATPADSFKNYTPFTIASGFVAGQNTLDFVVHNDNANPSALRVDGIGTVAPEPSSFAMFGFLGLGMAGLMLKARKRSASAA